MFYECAHWIWLFDIHNTFLPLYFVCVRAQPLDMSKIHIRTKIHTIIICHFFPNSIFIQLHYSQWYIFTNSTRTLIFSRLHGWWYFRPNTLSHLYILMSTIIHRKRKVPTPYISLPSKCMKRSIQKNKLFVRDCS